MEDCMVTGRMPKEKKDAGNAVLQRSGLTASAAINLMYDLLEERGNADFLNPPRVSHTQQEWEDAASFVQSLVLPFDIDERFLTMSKREIKMERLAHRGLV